MKTQAVIVAAGEGKRFKTVLPKPLALLNRKPVIFYTLRALAQSRLIESIILVVSKKNLALFVRAVKKCKLGKAVKIVEGGATRRESVYKGLKALKDSTDIVAIHDGVRPLVTADVINRTIMAALKYKAAIAALPVKSTVKTGSQNGFVRNTLERKTIFEVQTPQAFKKDIILRAHERIRLHDPTDDALLVEKLGVKVKIVLGDYRNIKITTREDLFFAEAILRALKK